MKEIFRNEKFVEVVIQKKIVGSRESLNAIIARCLSTYKEIVDTKTLNKQVVWKKNLMKQTYFIYVKVHQNKAMNFDFLSSTNHSTGDENIFHKVVDSVSSQVKMRNRVLVQTKGKSTIGVQTKRVVRLISDMLLISDLEQNLLSVG